MAKIKVKESEKVTAGYVVNGAKIQCSCGGQIAGLMTPSGHGTYLNGEAQLSVEDCKPGVNIQCFGQCASLSNPAVKAINAQGGKAQSFQEKFFETFGSAVVTVSPGTGIQTATCTPLFAVGQTWDKGSKSLHLEGERALYDSASLVCMNGGVISILQNGQNIGNSTGGTMGLMGIGDTKKKDAPNGTSPDYYSVFDPVKGIENNYTTSKEHIDGLIATAQWRTLILNIEQITPKGMGLLAAVYKKLLKNGKEKEFDELVKTVEKSKDLLNKKGKENLGELKRKMEGKKKEQKQEKNRNKWLGKEMMLGGKSKHEKYLSVKIEELNNKPSCKIKWNQTKIHELWAYATRLEKDNSIIVDPRIMLSIIFHEGTGSFNTSSKNLAADGQHGVEKDFGLDLMKANAFLFGKVLGYVYYGQEFRKAVVANRGKKGINRNGDFYQYANWMTPIVLFNRQPNSMPGVYAGDAYWHNGVREMYEGLAGYNSAEEYSKYLSNCVSKKDVEEMVGKLKDYEFVAVLNGQDSKGIPIDGVYTVIGK